MTVNRRFGKLNRSSEKETRQVKNVPSLIPAVALQSSLTSEKSDRYCDVTVAKNRSYLGTRHVLKKKFVNMDIIIKVQTKNDFQCFQLLYVTFTLNSIVLRSCPTDVNLLPESNDGLQLALYRGKSLHFKHGASLY